MNTQSRRARHFHAPVSAYIDLLLRHSDCRGDGRAEYFNSDSPVMREKMQTGGGLDVGLSGVDTRRSEFDHCGLGKLAVILVTIALAINGRDQALSMGEHHYLFSMLSSINRGEKMTQVYAARASS